MASKQDEQLKIFKKLEKNEKKILELLAVIRVPIARTPLLQCMAKARIRDKTRAFSLANLKPIVERLAQKKFLFADDRSGLQCPPQLTTIVIRELLKSGSYLALAEVVQSTLPPISNVRHGLSDNDYRILQRDLWIHFYRGDINAFRGVIEQITRFKRYAEIETLLNELLPNEEELINQVNPLMLDEIALMRLHSAHTALKVDPFVNEQFNRRIDEGSAAYFDFNSLRIYANHNFMRFGPHILAELIQKIDPKCEDPLIQTLSGWIFLSQGEVAKATEQFQQQVELLKKREKKRSYLLSGLEGVGYLLSLFASSEEVPQQISLATTEIEQYFKKKANLKIHNSLRILAAHHQGEQLSSTDIDTVFFIEDYALYWLFHLLSLYWMLDSSHPIRAEIPERIDFLLARIDVDQYPWLILQLLELKQQITPLPETESQITSLSQQINCSYPLYRLIRKREIWENSLTALININQSAEASSTESGERLVWLIEHNQYTTAITAKIQKLSKKGSWTKGRSLSFSRLYQDRASLPYLTTMDEKICAAIDEEVEGYGWYRDISYFIDLPKALRAMVGHPNIYIEGQSQIPVEVIEGEFDLQITQHQNSFSITLSPELEKSETYLIQREGGNRLRFFEASEKLSHISTIIGQGLTVPESARAQIMEAINSVSHLVQIHSDIEGDGDAIPVVEGDAQPHFHLLPSGKGISIELMVHPFSDLGPSYHPGKGGKNIIAIIKGEKRQAARDLPREKEEAQLLLNDLPSLEQEENDQFYWDRGSPEEALESIIELRELKDRAVIDWPEGERFRIRQRAQMQNFSMRISKDRDWFTSEGTLTLDDGQVIQMQNLLNLLDSANGRFIQMGEGEFIELSDSLRKNLDELRKIGEVTKKGVRFHPLAAPVLEDFIEEAGEFEGDLHWREQIERMHAAERYHPELPSTLQAELRDYQHDGFIWLARLAYWGVGACLADDMGLGKTLQSLALILLRAQQGPQLVIAPTSVALNWIDEARRFAPTLNLLHFSQGDRQEMINNAGPFDLVIVSYGLLQQEHEMLAEKVWHSVFLDEAQAIKNSATKRSKAAMALQADFKCICTGTPLENHLGELWNLFRFINPGLLGSKDRFNQRFAGPIEIHQDRHASFQLKRLIQPFILRRTKAEVLEELPPRTEIMHKIEMGQEEATFYEALRKQALDNLQNSEAAQPGQRSFEVLKQITRLRRAACNPKLILADSTIPSGKMEAFAEIVTELLENRHKALVFSQFVDHLNLVKTYLEQQGIRYQYLDGSTPQKKRKESVDAFQAGVGDVFLISLKAGGVGINLTAADYVIHLDPWWNPAVEDQASDRAHRMGQLRPVTIYRLVMQDTIEEQIVQMHHDKRSLADNLLDGSDLGGKLSADELINLIRD